VNTERPLTILISEIRQEVKDLLGTRFGLLKAEIKEKTTTWKSMLPFFLVAAALVATAWVTLTLALVAWIHALFLPSPFAWVWGALIVGGAYALIGVALGWYAYGEVTSVGIVPNRTARVLKEDQVWLQNEVRTI
jgi:hypothetical protein